MAPTTLTPPTSAAATAGEIGSDRPSATVRGPLLVATDGTGAADPALIAAQVIAERLPSNVDVLTVLEPASAYVPAPPMLALSADFDVAAMDRLRQRVQGQVRKVAGEPWPIDVFIGDAAATVRRVARERSASLIVTGVSRHGLMDRVFGEETAAHIANLTEIPMVAATASFTRLPRTVAIALDLDTGPIVMTPEIRILLADATAVYFVNAKPRTNVIDGFDLTSWERMYDEALTETYERVCNALDLPPAVTRQLVTLDGPTAKEILNFAQYANVELIIVGQRRASFLHRRFGSGLATRVLRATTCSVLVLPRASRHGARSVPEVPPPANRPVRTETLTDRDQWAARLAELSRRAAGRTVAVEIDDTELGAQAQVTGYPFMGVDHDRRDDRIEIMVGARGPGRAHLTHSIDCPTSVDVLERHDGQLLALRIANDRGQALISFIT